MGLTISRQWFKGQDADHVVGDRQLGRIVSSSSNTFKSVGAAWT